MVPASHLRVYQPLDSFDKKERAHWAEYIKSNPKPRRNLIHIPFGDEPHLGALIPADDGHALIKESNGRWMVCPNRTRIRALGAMLTSNLAINGPFPIVPPGEVRAAADELKLLYGMYPTHRVHIASAAWHVPIRWFVAFEDGERILVEESGQVTTRIHLRYEADLATARGRLNRAVEILSKAGVPQTESAAIQELFGWLSGFPGESLLELDYGNLGEIIPAEEMSTDRSAGEVWAALEALSLGDMEDSGKRYGSLLMRWERIRSVESLN